MPKVQLKASHCVQPTYLPNGGNIFSATSALLLIIIGIVMSLSLVAEELPHVDMKEVLTNTL